MATATTVEHSVPQASQVAQAPPRVGSRKISIDANLVAIASLFALALAAFGYLNGRLDTLSTELRGEIRAVNAKVDTLSSEMNARFDKVNDKIDRLSSDVNGKIDRLTDKINELIIEQSRARTH